MKESCMLELEVDFKTFIADLPEDDRASLMVRNPKALEKFLIESFLKVDLSEKQSGPDGFDEALKKHIEIKTQIAGLTSIIHGHIQYSDSTFSTYNKKIERGGELIYNACFDLLGNLLSIHKIEWMDIKEAYLFKIEQSAKRGNENGKIASNEINFKFCENCPSLEMVYVAPKEQLNSKWFSEKFYNFMLKDDPDGKIDSW